MSQPGIPDPHPLERWLSAGAGFAAALAAFGGIIAVVVGFCVLAYQIGLWLRYGVWTPMQMRFVWDAFTGGDAPHFSWLGVQAIAVWLLNFPMSAGLMIVGATTAVVAWSKLVRFIIQIVFGAVGSIVLITYIALHLP